MPRKLRFGVEGVVAAHDRLEARRRIRQQDGSFQPRVFSTKAVVG